MSVKPALRGHALIPAPHLSQKFGMSAFCEYPANMCAVVEKAIQRGIKELRVPIFPEGLLIESGRLGGAVP